MPIDFAAQHAQLLQHYIRLGANPGWRDYVWHRVQQMARDCPELFADFPAGLTTALKSAAPLAGSPPPSSKTTAPGHFVS